MNGAETDNYSTGPSFYEMDDTIHGNQDEIAIEYVKNMVENDKDNNKFNDNFFTTCPAS